jgi:hypothetical protein
MLQRTISGRFVVARRLASFCQRRYHCCCIDGGRWRMPVAFLRRLFDLGCISDLKILQMTKGRSFPV